MTPVSGLGARTVIQSVDGESREEKSGGETSDERPV